jgi:hypothetical protein
MRRKLNTANQCCGSGSGFGSGRLGPDLDPDTDPGLNKWPYINFFGVCKNHKYLSNLCFLTFRFMTTVYLLEHISVKKNFRRNLAENLFRS